jgi:predicted aldo/keto reductase-like oxidoreductase
MRNSEFNRRQFLGGLVAALSGLGSHSTRSLFGGIQDAASSGSRIKEYRILGRTGFKVSDIAFGSAELADSSLLRAVLDAGVNYIDSSEVYSNGGAERIIGRVIKSVDRRKVFVTTKIKVSENDTKASLLSKAEKCLERLQTDYIDCLMYHGPSTVEDVNNEAFHGALDELKSRDRVRFRGVSCHGAQWREVPVPMERILTAAAEDGRFDVMLLVYNFLQREQGEKVLEACRKNSVGAILMKTNPVLNYLERQEEADAAAAAGRELPDSRLATLSHLKDRANRAEEFKKQYGLTDYDQVRSAAIRFVLDHPTVSCVCATVKNFSDLDFYTALSGKGMDNAAKKSLSLYRSGPGRYYCRHACGVCESACPHGVPVNTIMRYDFYLQAQGRIESATLKYASLPDARKSSICMGCSGPCERACPYGVPVRSLLVRAHDCLTRPA